MDVYGSSGFYCVGGRVVDLRAAFGLGVGASELFGLSQGPAASISASRLDEMFLGHRFLGAPS